MNILAVDVASDSLMAYAGQTAFEVENTKKAIKQILAKHPDFIIVCEATSTYHFELADQAYSLGRTVFVVNPKEARAYKDSLSFRAKTDPLDAKYLYEYVQRNLDLLRPYVPLSQELRRLKKLIEERNITVQSRTALAMSFGKLRSPAHKIALKALDDLIKVVERQMTELASHYDSYKRLRSIPGVGPVIGCALVFLFESRTFDTPEAAVAFLGLDVRIRQSGKFKGRSKLTKRGDSTLRFLACLAGRSLLSSKVGLKKKAELIAKRRHFPERIAIAGRKVIKTAWFLYTTKTTFSTEKWSWG